jgi:hypothetical protein
MEIAMLAIPATRVSNGDNFTRHQLRRIKTRGKRLKRRGFLTALPVEVSVGDIVHGFKWQTADARSSA